MTTILMVLGITLMLLVGVALLWSIFGAITLLAAMTRHLQRQVRALGNNDLVICEKINQHSDLIVEMINVMFPPRPSASSTESLAGQSDPFAFPGTTNKNAKKVLH